MEGWKCDGSEDDVLSESQNIRISLLETRSERVLDLRSTPRELSTQDLQQEIVKLKSEIRERRANEEILLRELEKIRCEYHQTIFEPHTILFPEEKSIVDEPLEKVGIHQLRNEVGRLRKSLKQSWKDYEELRKESFRELNESKLEFELALQRLATKRQADSKTQNESESQQGSTRDYESEIQTDTESNPIPRTITVSKYKEKDAPIPEPQVEPEMVHDVQEVMMKKTDSEVVYSPRIGSFLKHAAVMLNVEGSIDLDQEELARRVSQAILELSTNLVKETRKREIAEKNEVEAKKTIEELNTRIRNLEAAIAQNNNTTRTEAQDVERGNGRPQNRWDSIKSLPASDARSLKKPTNALPELNVTPETPVVGLSGKYRLVPRKLNK